MFLYDDRFSENIKIYARGVNPSVSVSYNNTGITNGTNAMPQKQAHLPYKAFDNGAFRPPIIEGGLTQLLPQSRLNRNTTFSLSNKSNLRTAILNSTCDPPKKTIHKNLLKVQQKAALSRNPILVTALNPIIGYEKSASIAKKAYKEGRPVLDVAEQETDIPRAELEKLLDPAKLTEGGI